VTHFQSITDTTGGNDSSYAYKDSFIYDTNGAIDAFYGIKLTVTFALSPNNTPGVGTGWAFNLECNTGRIL
jgi:hypothetical protein